MLLEWHGEVAVQCLLGADRERNGLVRKIRAQAQAEEITHRRFYTRIGFAIPIRAQDKSFEVIRIVARNGDPDVAKDCGPVGVEQRERRSRSDFAVPTYLFRIFWYPKRRLNSLVSMVNWWQVLARLMRRYDGPKPMTRAMIRKGRGASCVSAIPLSPVHVERPVSPVRDGWLCQALHKCC